MSRRSLWSYVPPAGPVLSLLLIGLILLSGLLYYRAIKIQRFLEPALALSQPRNEFTKRINLLFQSEFSANPVKGLQVRMGSIVMHRSALFLPDNKMRPEGKTMLKKLARVFLALMEDPQARSGISRIMIMAPFESHELQGANVHQRMNSHVLVGFIQDALFYEEPRLGSLYAKYFATGTQPLGPGEKDDGTVNFIIMPSEYLHIKVLESLEKYSY